jgi:putative transposase
MLAQRRHLEMAQRHVVDTLGWLIAVVVTAASVQDRDGAKRLMGLLRHWFTRRRCMGAEGAYAGCLETWVMWLRRSRTVRLEIGKRSDQVQGCVVLPKRWIVARMFDWFGKYRRLSKDYESLTATGEAIMHLMVRRIAAKTPL